MLFFIPQSAPTPAPAAPAKVPIIEKLGDAYTAVYAAPAAAPKPSLPVVEKLGDAYVATYVNPTLAPATTSTFTLPSTAASASASSDMNRAVYYPDPLWWNSTPASATNWLPGATPVQAS